MVAPLAVWLSTTVPAVAVCPEPVPADRFATQLGEAETRFAAMEGTAFSEAMDESSFLVPCLVEVVTPELAARYHLLQGLQLFVTRNEEGAMRAFAAAKATAPQLGLATALVPEGHSIRELWATADPKGPTTRVPARVSGRIDFDGTTGQHRPSERPTLVQLVTDDGAVETTAWLEPGDPMPPYDAVREKTPDPGAERRLLPRTPLLVGAGAAGLVAGGLYGVAAVRAAAFEGPHPPSTELADLQASQRVTNTLVVSSAVVGGLSVATVGVAFVAGRW